MSREVIDFDPFLNSQDPCPRYKVTDVRSAGRSYRATVQPVCPNPNSQYWQTLDKHTSVQVIPEAGRWKIANVARWRAHGGRARWWRCGRRATC